MSQYRANRYYVAMGEKFQNMWNAYDRLHGTNYDIQPILENDVFANIRGTKIREDVDYEKITLEKLFSEYKNINLLYSGGIDCHTIAVKAKKFGFDFNRTITLGQTFDVPGTGVDRWLFNTGTKKFFKDDPNYLYVPMTLEWQERMIKSEWWKHDQEIGLSQIAHFSQTDIYNTYDIFVSGFDKPQLFFHDQQWYAYHHHTSLWANWHLPNCFYFFGINHLVPELLVSQARKARDFYVAVYGTPKEKYKFINHKSMSGTELYEQFIIQYNNSLGRCRLENSDHEINQTKINSILSDKGIQRFNQLKDAGRYDLVEHFLKDCLTLYKKHTQIQWEWPIFEVKGKIPWILNIDTLEYLDGSLVHDIINS